MWTVHRYLTLPPKELRVELSKKVIEVKQTPCLRDVPGVSLGAQTCEEGTWPEHAEPRGLKVGVRVLLGAFYRHELELT